MIYFWSPFKERGDLKRKEDDAKSEMRELRESVEDMKIKIETYVAEKRNITAEFRIQARTTISYWTEQLILKSTSGQAVARLGISEWQNLKKSSSWFWRLLNNSADLSKPWGRFFQILCVSQKVRTLQTKVRWRFCKILWPSQNICISLKHFIWKSRNILLKL